jgi:hypothetical protein
MRVNFDKMMNAFRETQVFTHPNLRKIEAFVVEELDANSISLGLIYEYASCNLYGLQTSDSEKL